MSLVKPSIFGRGLAYPLRLDPTGARPLVQSETDLVKSSIYRILKTDVSEEPLLSKNGVPFGTRIRHLLFDNEDSVKDILAYETRRALTTWEPRIIVIDVIVVVDAATQGSVKVGSYINYVYRSTSRPDSFIVPYRLARASS